VNPSLTITALAERAMTFIPAAQELPRGETDAVVEPAARAAGSMGSVAAGRR
jgi:cholesterol oxidase